MLYRETHEHRESWTGGRILASPGLVIPGRAKTGGGSIPARLALRDCYDLG